MKLAQIEAFYSVIRAGSISQAARQMHISQPALSVQIRELEDFFKVQLLQRTNKGVKATPAGILVFYYGQKMINTREALCREIDKLLNDVDLKLLVGASTVVGGYVVPHFLHCFQTQYPEAEVHLHVGSSLHIAEMLLDGKVDIAVLEGPVPNQIVRMEKEMVTRNIGYDDLVLVGSPVIMPEGKKKVSLDEIREYPLILCEQGSGVRASVDKSLLEKGIHPSAINISMELNSIDAIKVSLTMGLHFSILPLLSIQKELEFGTLRTLSISEFSGKIPFMMIYIKKAFLSKVEKEFISFLCSGEPPFAATGSYSYIESVK